MFQMWRDSDHARNHTPALLLGRERLDAIPPVQIETGDVLPPPIEVGNKHVHYEIVCQSST
jgi:hypothetical protein